MPQQAVGVSNHSYLHVLKDRTVPFHSNAEFCDKPLLDVKPPKSYPVPGKDLPTAPKAGTLISERNYRIGCTQGFRLDNPV
jgi:hypothetical protein